MRGANIHSKKRKLIFMTFLQSLNPLHQAAAGQEARASLVLQTKPNNKNILAYRWNLVSVWQPMADLPITNIKILAKFRSNEDRVHWVHLPDCICVVGGSPPPKVTGAHLPWIQQFYLCCCSTIYYKYSSYFQNENLNNSYYGNYTNTSISLFSVRNLA